MERPKTGSLSFVLNFHQLPHQQFDFLQESRPRASSSRPSTTLSHPIGEGQEGESFASGRYYLRPKTYRLRQVSASLSVFPQRLSCAYMRKIYSTAQRRSFRRWVRQLFCGWIKRRNGNCLAGIEKVIEKLQDIEDSIEIIAREIARPIKSGK